MEVDRGAGGKSFFVVAVVVVVASPPVLSCQLISAYLPARWNPRGTHLQFDWEVLQRLYTSTHTHQNTTLQQLSGAKTRVVV